MGCENNCVNKHRIKSLEEDLKEYREKSSRDHKEFFDRIEKVEKDMVESQGDRKHIREQLDKINGNVETLIQKPAKRYDAIITSVFTAIIGAIVGFILSGALQM